MKPVQTLTTLFLAFVLSGFPVAAQEHVDVPLPPYDPPPKASHHSETSAAEPSGAPRKAHARPKVSKRSHSKPQAKKNSSTHRKKQNKSKKKSKPKKKSKHKKKSKSRHHGFFHWPWQH
jgi:hypothetical protein